MTGFAAVMVGGWLLVSVIFVLALGLMSVDEEFAGWSDLLPLLALYLAFTGGLWTGVWVLARR